MLPRSVQGEGVGTMLPRSVQGEGVGTMLGLCAMSDNISQPKVLKAERPDVDAKRSDLLKLQGEFMLKLRHLEQSLLQALNEVKGRILDDDRIITQLESLKREAAEVQRKVEETDVVMAEVERVSLQYRPLSSSCSSIYFTLESLNQVCTLDMAQ